MPIYEYRCKKRHVFEVVQSMADDPLTECVKCGARCERVLHAPAVHFKGKGFYNTDYGTKKRNRETTAASAAEKSSSKSTEKASSDGSSSEGTKKKSGSDSKPAASSPSKSSD